MAPLTLDMQKAQRVQMTSEEYARLSSKEREAFRLVGVVPPRLGSRGFGKVLLEYKLPTFAPAGGAFKKPRSLGRRELCQP